MLARNLIASIAVVTSVGVATMPTAQAGLGHWLSHVSSSRLDQFEHSAVGALSIGAGVAAVAGGIIMIGVPGVGVASILGGMALLGVGTGGEVFGFHEMFLSDDAQKKVLVKKQREQRQEREALLQQWQQGSNVSRNDGTRSSAPAEPAPGQGVANAGMHH